MSLHARASLTLGKIAVALAFAGIAIAARADTVRVTVAHYSDATAPYFEKMARQFEKANPGTTIKIEDVSWDTLQQKLQRTSPAARMPIWRSSARAGCSIS